MRNSRTTKIALIATIAVLLIVVVTVAAIGATGGFSKEAIPTLTPTPTPIPTLSPVPTPTLMPTHVSTPTPTPTPTPTLMPTPTPTLMPTPTPTLMPTPTPTPTHIPTPTPTPTPTTATLYPLEYRMIDGFTTEAIRDVIGRANAHYYELPDEIVEWPYYALYIVIENLDDVPGVFEVPYTLTTADKEAAERQRFLMHRTPEEWEELNREYYEGNIELYLEPDEVGVAICPPEGIFIAPDRVPFDHEHEIIPPLN